MKRLFVLLLAFAAAVACADEIKPARVDFTSVPEGASVVIDGTSRGVTPLTLYDLALTRHHIRYELKNYETVDDFVTLSSGAYISRHAELVPVKGLLLLTSEPAGCSITLDGLSLGETPRLVTTLEARNVYRLQLQKPGYQTAQVEVRFAGRTPLVKHEKLILDSGVVEIRTEPAGAEVTVNGISRGKTPVTVSDIPKGRATVQLKLAGFRDAVREISMNAGDTQTLFVALEGEPGSLHLTSVPDGARFYVNGDPRGKGPLVIRNLAPGAYTVRAELEGHAPVERTVQVAHGAEASEEFRLENTMGRLEIRTAPTGATVTVDGHSVGVTRNADPGAEVSEVLLVENLAAGEHTVIIKKEGFGEALKHPVVENQKATKLDVRLRRVFKPDVEIVTSSGVYRGVLVSNGADAIQVEVSMGVVRSFPRIDIRKVNFLDGDGK